MRPRTVRRWSRLGVLTLSLSLLGCGPTLPPAQQPDEHAAPQPELRPMRDSGDVAVPKAFAAGNEPAPVQMRSDAPPPVAQPQGGSLAQPDQPPLSIGDLQGALPNKIPQGMAGALLRPLDQGGIADVRAPGLPPGAPDGCAYGALPDLVDYGVYPRMLYYNFRSVWVPYILVDDCYYPYVYQPYFDPLFAGYCYYPLFVFRHGFYYPYYFHSRSYYYGYLDWEYNWPRYRDRHSDYDWSDIGRRRLRRYNDDDFQQWRDGRIRQRDREDWQRVEPPRRSRERDADQDRPVERPDAPRAERQEPRAERQNQRQEAKRDDRGDRAASKEGRERAERSSRKSAKQQNKQGRKDKGERRTQSDEEDALEQATVES